LFTIGFAGRLVKEKGLDTLVRAVRRLGPEVELIIAGDGPLRSWLEEIDLGGARLRVIRGTEHTEMADVYAQMDVLVLPSRTTSTWAEQFGRVLVEAMWCGTPVIGSDSGEIPHVIHATGGGEVFPEGDAAALAALVARLIADRPLRETLAQRGRDRVEALFSVTTVADQFEETLHDSAGVRYPAGRWTKPRVALVAHGLHDGGGMERACAELIRHCSGVIDFHVVSAELAPELRPLVWRWTRIGVPSRPIPFKFAVFWLRAGRTLRVVDTDLVHTVGAIVPNRIDLASIHFCQAAFIARAGCLAPQEAPVLRRINTATLRLLGLLAERWSYRPSRLRAFGAVSQGVADELAEHYPAVPCTVTANGVDLSRFRPDKEARLVLRGAERRASSRTVALFVGGDWSRKGLEVAIAAVGEVRRMGKDIELWVVGEGDQSRFQQFSARQGLTGHVHFWGTRSDTERFYQAADLFVLPSAYEAFSLACLEAAACGLPVVVPPISGADEIVGYNEGGLLVTRTVPSFADALARLTADPDLRSTLGAAAHERVQSYTWERSAASVMGLYRALLASK
jgi:glycosyltransferase involved in cell wall biosynthesis